MNNRLLKTVLLGVAVAGVITSCQKDEMKNDILVYHEMSQKNLAQVNPNTLTYWINGVEYQMEFSSLEEMQNYISYLLELTRQGYVITIKGSDNPSMAPAQSDKLTFETKDRIAMDAWALEMNLKGYTVTYSFGEGTGLYTGTATKGGSRTMAANLSERE
jgi:hypothetical protein